MDTGREPALPPFGQPIVRTEQQQAWDDLQDKLRAYRERAEGEDRERWQAEGRQACERETHEDLALTHFESGWHSGHQDGREQGRREGAWTALVVCFALACVAGWLARKS